jgi:hypothetical protein
VQLQFIKEMETSSWMGAGPSDLSQPPPQQRQAETDHIRKTSLNPLD